MTRRAILALVLAAFITGALTVIAAGVGYFVWRDVEARQEVTRLRELEQEARQLVAESAKLHTRWRAESVGPEGLPLPDRSFSDDPRQAALAGRYKAAVAEHDGLLDRHPDWHVPRLPRKIEKVE